MSLIQSLVKCKLKSVLTLTISQHRRPILHSPRPNDLLAIPYLPCSIFRNYATRQLLFWYSSELVRHSIRNWLVLVALLHEHIPYIPSFPPSLPPFLPSLSLSLSLSFSLFLSLSFYPSSSDAIALVSLDGFDALMFFFIVVNGLRSYVIISLVF